jgi:hypothetical protein
MVEGARRYNSERLTLHRYRCENLSYDSLNFLMLIVANAIADMNVISDIGIYRTMEGKELGYEY